MSGRLTDMSMAGCFVLAPGLFTDGDLVRLYFPHSDGSSVEILSEIKNHVPEIGFGVRFRDLNEFRKSSSIISPSFTTHTDKFEPPAVC